MSATSGRTSPPPLAFYDPDSRSLKTSQRTLDEGLTPSSPTLPASGSMRSGALFAHRRSALLTAAIGSSSSPGLPNAVARLLPTPRTSDTNGVGTHGSGGPDLRTVISLLPTPTSTNAHGNQRNNRGELLLPGVVAILLPTPAATDATRGRTRRGGSRSEEMLLSEVAHQASTGGLTPRPSPAGSTSSDDLPLGQLTIEDALRPSSSSGCRESTPAMSPTCPT